MMRSPAVERLILKRLILTFPDEGRLKIPSSSDSYDLLDALPDQSLNDTAEKIAETKKELRNASNL